jgi:hypothetical protein
MVTGTGQTHIRGIRVQQLLGLTQEPLHLTSPPSTNGSRIARTQSSGKARGLPGKASLEGAAGGSSLACPDASEFMEAKTSPTVVTECAQFYHSETASQFRTKVIMKVMSGGAFFTNPVSGSRSPGPRSPSYPGQIRHLRDISSHIKTSSRHIQPY